MNPSRPSTSTPRRPSSADLLATGQPARRPALHPGALRGAWSPPTASWVAWSWSRLGPAADVFAAPTDGSRPPLRLTETAEGDTLVVSWTPTVNPCSSSQDNDGDERDRLFRSGSTEPGTMEPLTQANPNYYIRGGQLHPNGRWLVYAANLDAETGEEMEADLALQARPEDGREQGARRAREGKHSPARVEPRGHPRALLAQRSGPGRAADLAGGHRRPTKTARS